MRKFASICIFFKNLQNNYILDIWSRQCTECLLMLICIRFIFDTLQKAICVNICS